MAERQPQRARELAKELLGRETTPPTLARIHNALAMAEYMANDFPSAIASAREAERLAVQHGLRDQLAYALYHQGSSLWRTGDYSGGYELTSRALRIFEETNDLRGQLYAANRASTILAELNYYGKALEFNDLCLRLARQINDAPFYARALSNRAYIHYRQDDLPKMLEVALLSIQAFGDVPGDLFVRHPLINAGVACLEMSRYHDAAAFLERSLPISRQAGDRMTELIAWKFLARTHKNLKKYPLALTEAFKALAIANEVKSPFELKNIDTEISDVYAALGDHRRAYQFLSEAVKLQGQLQKSEINEKIALAIKQADIEKREREIKLLQQEKTIADLRLQQQHHVRDLLLLVATCLAAGIAITLRAYVARRRAHRIISSKNVELRTIDRIVQEINQQRELGGLIDSIFQHTLALVPQTQKGGFLYYIEEADRFRPVVLYRYRPEEVERIEFTPEEARRRYKERSDVVAEGVYLLRNPALASGAERLREVIELPKAILTLELEVDGRTLGYLLFENMDDSQAFSDADVDRLVRIRAHLISALAKTHYIAKLEEASRTDPLTRLLNRRGMVERLHQEIDRFHRYKHPFSVAIGDLDDFKKVNDTFGHEAGDCALVTVATVFRNKLRKVDQMGRWGGEEFLILLPSTTEGNAVVAVEKVRAAVRDNPARFRDREIPLSITFGVVEFAAGASLDDCLLAADEALYAGKSRGKNQVMTFSQLASARAGVRPHEGT